MNSELLLVGEMRSEVAGGLQTKASPLQNARRPTAPPMRNADYQYRLQDRSVNPHWVTLKIEEIEAGDWRSLPRSPYWPAPTLRKLYHHWTNVPLDERAGNRKDVGYRPVAARLHAPVDAVCNGKQRHGNESA